MATHPRVAPRGCFSTASQSNQLINKYRGWHIRKNSLQDGLHLFGKRSCRKDDLTLTTGVTSSHITVRPIIHFWENDTSFPKAFWGYRVYKRFILQHFFIFLCIVLSFKAPRGCNAVLWLRFFIFLFRLLHRLKKILVRNHSVRMF